ncbi:hypothetical protein BKA64DRAFT_586177 [Cadophora sp. MPI-SDFR-AT-0126]|nr:hypothetical protein BKA64DRAFT_586177 [Leotiomycetes sp. MPI-SDFR-AT-0126]
MAETYALDLLPAQLVKAHHLYSDDPRPRRLIVCCDGTWMKNDTDQPLSNVARIGLCLADCDRRGEKHFTQVVHYQSGVGTSSWGALNLYEGAFAQAIGQDIRDAYGFICDNYRTPDDEIILIGFSRGAFTVRALASLIADIGVLNGAGRYSLSKVYELWEKQLPSRSLGDGPLTSPAAPAQEPEISHEISDLEHYVRDLQKVRLTQYSTVNIKVCAVWDTVAAIGAKLPKFLPQIPSKKLAFVDKKTGSDAAGRPRVENVFQALALDEKRFHFQPMLWQRHQTQNLTQCWFRGSHSDVGGGNVNSGLANISLAWMMGKLEPFALFDVYRISQLSQDWGLIPHLLGRDGRESKKPFKMPPQNFRVYNSYTKRYWLGMSEERHPGAVNNGTDTNESVHISVFRLGDDPSDSRIVHKSVDLNDMAKAQWVDGDLEHKILKAWRKSEGDPVVKKGLNQILGVDAEAALQAEEPAATGAA